MHAEAPYHITAKKVRKRMYACRKRAAERHKFAMNQPVYNVPQTLALLRGRVRRYCTRYAHPE